MADQPTQIMLAATSPSAPISWRRTASPHRRCKLTSTRPSAPPADSSVPAAHGRINLPRASGSDRRLRLVARNALPLTCHCREARLIHSAEIHIAAPPRIRKPSRIGAVPSGCKLRFLRRSAGVWEFMVLKAQEAIHISRHRPALLPGGGKNVRGTTRKCDTSDE